jgi:HD-GYP domain-containing protein (c-di-GMP phosphodiesterase class II)
MRSPSRRWVHLAGVAATLASAFLCVYQPVFLQNREYDVYDALVRVTPTREPSGQVVIVDVDERSLSSIGQWPWRRDVVARLIARLRDLGASTVALDIVFAEPERPDDNGPDGDAALAETVGAGKVVLGYAMVFEDGPGSSKGCFQHPMGLAIIRRDDEASEDPFFRASNVICNLQILSRAAAGSGFMNAAPDADGILRRVPLLAEFDGAVFPSLALAAVSASGDTRDALLHAANVNSSTLVLTSRAASDAARQQAIPLDGNSSVLLRYRGVKRTFPYVSAVDVLRGDVPPGVMSNKVVFVGTTALGTREVVATPLDTLFTGVEVQATVADNLLQRDPFQRPAFAVVIEAVAVLAVGFAAVFFGTRFGPVWCASSVALLAAAVWAGAAALMINGIYLSPLFPSLGLVAGLIAMTAAGFLEERRRADHAGAETATARRLMIQSLLSLVEVRDAETGRHSRRTRQLTRALAEALAPHPAFRGYLTPERIDLLSTLAPLHDIGKVGVPDRILHKPGPLTADERIEMRRHPEYGRNVIVNAERAVGVRDDLTLAIAKDIVYSHHERWDGSGYPEGLRGAEIPIAGRLIAVVDVYDALLASRPYHRAMAHDEVMAVIIKGRGTHFDPDVVDAWIDLASRVERLVKESDEGALVA